MDKIKIKSAYIWLLVILIDLLLVFLNQSMYDSGDSILHYLYSKQTFQYPKYLMDHWAKPIFVLLSAPFTFFGWYGMKLFNALCILGSSFYLYKLFESYNFKKWLALILCFSAPAFFLVQSSGLTEPLFALILIAVIYHIKAEKFTLALILLSFLPFVRSEGWIIACLILPYLLIEKKYKYLPYILVGSVLYGVIGYFHYDDFLWMFHQNPYSGTEVKYGSGNWMHFFDQLPYVIGFPLFALVLLGYYDAFWRITKGQLKWFEFFMIYGIATGYFAAHTIFWAEGLFHSFGLNRVLIVIIPLYAFIAYRGIERIACAFTFIKPKYIWWVMGAIVILFPFTSNKAGLRLPQSVEKEPLMRMIDDIVLYTDSAYGERTIYFGNTYIPLAYDVDIDNQEEAVRIGSLKYYDAKEGSLVLWDSYFAPSDQNITTEELAQKEELELVKRFECQECRKNYYVDLYFSK